VRGERRGVSNGVDQGQLLITGAAGTIGRVIVHGNDGNDPITVSTGVTVDAVVYGRAGNDTITGGGDVLNGGAGRNVMVGGLGQDTPNGGSVDDILIGGPDFGLQPDGRLAERLPFVRPAPQQPAGRRDRRPLCVHQRDDAGRPGGR
jgi:Ca2+-binding RTX toxin-like protein